MSDTDSPQGASHDAGGVSQLREREIATRCSACLALTKHLLPLLRANSDDSVPAIQDELGRFRVWVANLAAHRTGRISLDYRLRFADRVRNAIIELLSDLYDVLSRGLYAPYKRAASLTRIFY